MRVGQAEPDLDFFADPPAEVDDEERDAGDTLRREIRVAQRDEVDAWNRRTRESRDTGYAKGEVTD
jgi:hypothetical protein